MQCFLPLHLQKFALYHSSKHYLMEPQESSNLPPLQMIRRIGSSMLYLQEPQESSTLPPLTYDPTDRIQYLFHCLCVDPASLL